MHAEVRPIKPLVSGVGIQLAGLRISPSQLLIGGWTVVGMRLPTPEAAGVR